MNQAEKMFNEWVEKRDNPWEDKEEGFYFKEEIIEFAMKFAERTFLHAREGEYGVTGNPSRVSVKFKFKEFNDYLESDVQGRDY